MEFEFPMEVEDFEKLDALANKQGLTRDELVSQILNDFLRGIARTGDNVRFSVGAKKGPNK